MFIEVFILEMVEFIKAYPQVVLLLMAIVQKVKEFIKDKPWYKGWYMTIFAFVIAFLFAIPAQGFEVIPFIAGGLGLGLISTGLYDIIDEVFG